MWLFPGHSLHPHTSHLTLSHLTPSLIPPHSRRWSRMQKWLPTPKSLKKLKKCTSTWTGGNTYLGGVMGDQFLDTFPVFNHYLIFDHYRPKEWSDFCITTWSHSHTTLVKTDSLGMSPAVYQWPACLCSAPPETWLLTWGWNWETGLE